MGALRVQVLSYRFSVGWDWEEAGAYVRFSMARFVPQSWDVEDGLLELPRYSLSSAGRYRLDLDGDLISESRDQRDVLNHFSWHVNSTAMRVATDRLVIHAGAVVSPTGEGILLPGPSGSGKTSLVAELVRTGFGYLSDEAAGIDAESLRVLPYPKALSIKQGMFRRFSELDEHSRAWRMSGRMWLVDPDSLREDSVAGPSTAAFVIFPTHRIGARTRVSPLSAAESVIALHENIANRSIFGPRVLPLLGDLAKNAASYRLETGDPDEAVRAVRELTVE
jgi:hypothetical protein